MGRAKKRGRKKKSKRPDAEAVLGGRVEVDLRTLQDLVRRANPDERGVSPSEAQRRRGLQCQLLGLMINRFGDELAVDWESRPKDLAALRLRATGKPAGQVLVEELEPEARAWMREHLGSDDAEAPDEADDHQGSGDAANEDWRTSDLALATVQVDDDLRGLSAERLLRRGRAALEEYDYDEARRHLWAACHASHGGLQPSLALAEVLVNHLAAYEEALGLLSLIGSSAASDPELRQLLGMAAARAGDHSRAEQLVRALDGEGVVEVYLVLAGDALGREDHESCGRFLGEARQQGQVTQELLHLEEQLGTLRARIWKPREEEIEALVARGELEDAEALARDLRGQWPDSAVARRVLAEAERLRRQHRQQEALAEAEAARQREEYSSAAALLRKAMDLGADRQQLEPRLQRWEAAAHQQEDSARAARVGEALEGGDVPGALMMFLDSTADQRRLVRELASSPVLGWLEQMDAPRSGTKARAAVEAALALEQAGVALDAEGPAAARALLAPHGKALESVDRARRLQQRCDDLLLQKRRQRAAEALAQAREALAAGALNRARELLESLDRQALEAGDVATADAALASVDEQEETARLLDRYRQCLEAEELMGARQAAALLEQRGGDDAERWRAKQEELKAGVRRQWRIQVKADAGAAHLRDHLLRQVHDTAEPWLTADGEDLVLVDVYQRWVFVRQVELDGRRARCLVSLRTPAPMGRLLSAVVDGDRLWLAGGAGRLMCLDRRTWDVLRWDDFGTLVKQGETIERARVIPPGRYLWVVTERGGSDWMVRVIDLSRWRVHRRLPGFIFQFPAGGFPEALVACRGDEGRSAVFTAQGKPAPHKTALNMLASDAAVHPDGQSLLLLHPHLTEETYQDDVIPLALSCLAPDGSSRRLAVLDDSDQESLHNVATSLDQGLTFALHWVRGEECDLLGLRTTGKEAERLFTARVPVGTCLAQDAEAWRVAALVPDDEDVTLVRLDSQAPPPPGERAADRGLPRFNPPFLCHEEIGASRERADQLLGRLRELVAGQVAPWARQYFERHQEDVGALVDLRFALNTSGFAEVGRELTGWTWELFPQDSRVALSHAEVLAAQQRWGEVRRVLEALPDADMDRPRPRHFYHLLGVAQYQRGEDRRATRTWELGARIRSGRCDLAQYTGFVEPMEDPPRPEDWSPGQPLSRQLRGAMLTADACLARGDAAGAIGALSRLGFTQSRELQRQARLAEAHLRLEPAENAGRFHKAVALAALCHRLDDEGLARVELPVAGHAWDGETLRDVAARAAAWLEGYGVK